MRPPTHRSSRYIETGRDRLAEAKPNPGRATLHRLNRTEYANAVRDLLALEIDVAELLPADDIGYGFDNIGDVLQVSPVLLERYLSVARKISRCRRRRYDDARGLSDLYRSSRARSGRSSERNRAGRLARRHRRCATCSRSTASTRFRSPCKGTGTTNILGLERERKLDLRLDDQRLQLFTIAANAKRRSCSAAERPPMHISRSACR